MLNTLGQTGVGVVVVNLRMRVFGCAGDSASGQIKYLFINFVVSISDFAEVMCDKH